MLIHRPKVFLSAETELFMNLTKAEEGREYVITSLETHDEEMDAFLFSLGCYGGEPITVISRHRGTCVVAIKEGRYSIDNKLAATIFVA